MYPEADIAGNKRIRDISRRGLGNIAPALSNDISLADMVAKDVAKIKGKHRNLGRAPVECPARM